MIATIIMATVFTGAALSQLYSFQNSFKEVSIKNQEIFATSIVIIGETNASSPNRIVVWVKNTGQTPFALSGLGDNASYWDVFITFPNGTYQRFTYNPTAQYNCWSVQILNGAGGVWQTGETIQLTIYTSSVPSGAYDVRLTLSNGVGAEDKFSLS